jgi:predicted lipoprotein
VAQPSSQQLTAARAAWRNALRTWSRAELFQFGPAASSAMSAGKDLYQGKGLRERIYAWPAATRCRVEEQILEQASDLEGAFVSGRGLFALEYLLFYENTDSACPAEGRVAREWNALSAEEINARKLAYAAVLVKDIRAQVDALLDAWNPNPDRGNFKPTFVSASGYPSEQEAMNVLGWALIYIEREVKDWKLGIPAGYTLSAPVTGPETPFARVDTDTVRANLHGFRALFQGCAADGSGLGFDDWLAKANHAELADDIIAAYGEAQAKLDATPQLHEASSAEIEAAYQALRKLTNLLKGDLFGAGSPINLKLPANVEGDTD